MGGAAPTPPRRVVYLAHGGDKYTKQAIYSIHTLLHWMMLEGPQNIQVVVYTDNTAWVPQHESIVIRPLAKEILRTYMGEFGYVHRVKLAVLAHAQQNYDGTIIFVDCDTKWTRSPSSAFEALESSENLCFMHENEGDITESKNAPYFHALTKGFPFQQRFDIAPPWTMWNSGTIGIPRGNPSFFIHTLEITDEVTGKVRKGNWVEQLAVSLLATSQFDVRPFHDYLQHFWRDSDALPRVIDKVLPKLSGDLASDAKVCADFPFEQELKSYAGTRRAWVHKRAATLKRSFRKRLNALKQLLKKKSYKTRMFVRGGDA